MRDDRLPQTGEGVHGERLSDLPNTPADFHDQGGIGELYSSAAEQLAEGKEEAEEIPTKIACVLGSAGEVISAGIGLLEPQDAAPNLPASVSHADILAASKKYGGGEW